MKSKTEIVLENFGHTNNTCKHFGGMNIELLLQHIDTVMTQIIYSCLKQYYYK